MREAFDRWWKAQASGIAQLAGKSSFVGLRNELLDSFSKKLEPLALLDRFQVRGIVAGFWEQSKYDFLTLMARGCKGIIDARRSSVLASLEDESAKDDSLDHKLVKALLGTFVAELAALEAKKSELEAQLKSATPDDTESEEESDDEDAVDEVQLAAWKKDLTATKRQLKADRESFAKQLNAAVDALDEKKAATLLLAILAEDMRAILNRYVTQHRQQVIAAFENWWDKYRVTLVEIERQRDAAAKQLQEYLSRLGYV